MEQNNNQNGNGSASKNNSTNLIIAGIAIIVVIALAVAIPYLKRPHSAAAPTVDTTATAATPGTASSQGNTVGSLSDWQNLFQQYNGKIVVFAADCSTLPTTQTQPKGTTVLLMNNSNVRHTFTVGGAPFMVAAYHYKTYTFKAPGTLTIGCDAHTNAASVVVK